MGGSHWRWTSTRTKYFTETFRPWYDYQQTVSLGYTPIIETRSRQKQEKETHFMDLLNTSEVEGDGTRIEQ